MVMYPLPNNFLHVILLTNAYVSLDKPHLLLVPHGNP
jgi:hypothetical protein